MTVRITIGAPLPLVWLTWLMVAMVVKARTIANVALDFEI
jgi:hypothetical protein